MVTGAAGQQDLAAIGLMDAGDDLDQRRFAGAVLAEQGVDLAGIEGERDVLERLRGVEPLGDVAHLEDGRRAAGRRFERQRWRLQRSPPLGLSRRPPPSRHAGAGFCQLVPDCVRRTILKRYHLTASPSRTSLCQVKGGGADRQRKPPSICVRSSLRFCADATRHRRWPGRLRFGTPSVILKRCHRRLFASAGVADQRERAARRDRSPCANAAGGEMNGTV